MYEVVMWMGSDWEFVGATKSLNRAGITAQNTSLEDGISEVIIYDDKGVIVEVWVNGNEVDLDEYNAYNLEDDYAYDELGYDPYSGCSGWDC